MSRYFSDRHGFGGPEPEIMLREAAPEELRFGVAAIARNAGMKPSTIRHIICSVLFEAPDQSNWSEYPNIWDEVLRLLRSCEWYKVYDIAETLWRNLEYDFEHQDLFQNELNRLFKDKGIGWELKSPNGIVYRGDATFTALTDEAEKLFTATERQTAATEIKEALKDISRRPEPDRTGAIQHSMAALECVARHVTGQPKPTLGELIPRLNLPNPLDQALPKIWGYASERGRHLREGRDPSASEAELVVSLACALGVYLIRRNDEIP
ncbi:AbiJ-NTD4 domain-containing protein [Pleomorphomonas carboxyditropha]|uniref:HEPN AbiJ-N-terminal domain-containing protein n=1 Tax=Pleomorphomonas carboxyditropha TaxID=2023338 RepID=A0A2G9WXT1_9HYPH|nr:hypothetical protein [Pleomorphomonas carboxyditropha]PIO99474.1 hypothetical protein CJ014_09155 [Pleomorphomonas carboxyditropha]